MFKAPFVLFATAVALALDPLAFGQRNSTTPILDIDAGKVTAHVSPTLYGLMTEEINYSYDGGLYGELIQNRIFRDSEKEAKHWSVVQDTGATATISLDESEP